MWGRERSRYFFQKALLIKMQRAWLLPGVVRPYPYGQRANAEADR
jgi:hypothetical protein